MTTRLFSQINGASWDEQKSLRVENEEALQCILQEAKEIGYTIKSLRENQTEEIITSMERAGAYLWYASLYDIQFGKCGTCEQYIPINGIYSHKMCCQKCGAVLYLEVMDGTQVEFTFQDDVKSLIFKSLFMKAYSWDDDYLYLYPTVEYNHSGIGRFSPEEANIYLQAHRDSWEYVWYHEKKLLRVAYDHLAWGETSVKHSIAMSGIYGHHYNVSVVKLWQGKEYGESDTLPIPESFIIYERWRATPSF